MPAERAYPAPSLVIGVGRFGLALLERLGRDWQFLSTAGADPSLANLRLVHWRAEGDDDGPWRAAEARQVALARHVDGGDLPSLALDFVLLRTLGLVRHQHGEYQVAVPVDHGVVSVDDGEGANDGSSDGAGDGSVDRGGRLVRRRSFRWLPLDPDPLGAAEALRRRAEQQSELHLFIAPILDRIRQGHAPSVLLDALRRCDGLARGRDPSPWPWLRRASPRQAPRADGRSSFDALLDGFAPPPSAGPLVLSPVFRPEAEDPEVLLDPRRLLAEDWQSAGWASRSAGWDGGDPSAETPFAILPVSEYRLGLFDHDPFDRADERAADAEDRRLAERLRRLGDRVHRGLARLWVDLEREQVEEGSGDGGSRADGSDGALRQSLRILHELVVRPVEAGPERDPEPLSGKIVPGQGTEWDVRALPAEPSPFLRSLRLRSPRLDFPGGGSGAGSVLDHRLADLGLLDPSALPRPDRPLLREVAANPNSGLRAVLNREVRELLDFDHLAASRPNRAGGPSRQPPRLTVFVVADMGEPFARVTTTDVLRDVHSELLRAFGSIFERHRQGFDRALSVVPILWMPHPADPFADASRPETTTEEAVILDAVHRLRRWVESVLPGGRRRISQVFVNGRVTDNAVLTVADSLDQTRDFLALQVRNDLAADDWLRRAAVGPGGDDLFASFACREIELPAERAREYLANRLARECLHRLRTERRWRPGPSSSSSSSGPSESLALVEPPEEEPLVAWALDRLHTLVEQRATDLAEKIRAAEPGADTVGGMGSGDGCAPARAYEAAFGPALVQELWSGLVATWRRLARPRGRMDELVDGLRHQVSRGLESALPEIRRASDLAILRTSTHGLPAVLDTLGERRRRSLALLHEVEAERRAREEACRHHRRPLRADLESACDAVVRVARDLPDCGPLGVGVLAWLLLAPAATGLLVSLLASEWGPLTAFLAAILGSTATVAIALRAHRRRSLGRVRTAIEALVEAVRRQVVGDAAPAGAPAIDLGGPPSLRSFFEARIRLTAALARRAHAFHAFREAGHDEGLGRRIERSCAAQEQVLKERAEALGVRPGPMASTGLGAGPVDDLHRLFDREGASGGGASPLSGALPGTLPGALPGTLPSLLDPSRLEEYYRGRVSGDALPVAELLEKAGELELWRTAACLADTEAVLAFGRDAFPSSSHGGAHAATLGIEPFVEEVGERLRHFVRRYSSSLGFGAQFMGYEGLDPDGVHLVADARLVAGEALVTAWRRAEEDAREAGESKEPSKESPGASAALACAVRPHAAYLLCLAQGIRAHSVRNLKRFESFHDRVRLPLGAGPGVGPDPGAVHLLSGCEDRGQALLNRLALGESGPVDPAERSERGERS